MNAFVRVLMLAAPVALATGAFCQPTSHSAGSRDQEGLSFEAASVKPTTGRSLCNLVVTPGRLTAGTVSLHCLITKAYDITDRQLVGVSGWMDSDVYSVMATAGKAVDRAQMMAMLKNLLGERFQLRAHVEARKTQVLALVVDKGGPKFQPLAEGESDVPPASLSSAQLMTLPWGPTISNLVQRLNFYSPANLGDRLVVDRTGLTGRYKMWVSFDNETNPDGVSGKADIDISSAMKQLGLALKPEQADVPFVVVEKAARPEAQ